MSEEKFLTKSAVMLFLFKQHRTEILLQKRYNTGYADGMWDCAASGHVEANESMKMAIIREAKEELGIYIDIKYVDFALLMHKYTPSTGNIYYNGYFTVNKYEGTPNIMEPDKCSDLQWFNIKNLPDNFIADRKQALQSYLSSIFYDEIGWETFQKSSISMGEIKI